MAEGISTSDALFVGRDQEVRSTYRRLLEALRSPGPFEEEPKKTSIHLVRGEGFAGVHPRKSYLVLSLRTASALESPRISKAERVSKNRFHQEVKLTSPRDIDEELLGWLKEVYEPGS